VLIWDALLGDVPVGLGTGKMTGNFLVLQLLFPITFHEIILNAIPADIDLELCTVALN